MTRKTAITLLLACLLVGCESNPAQPVSAAPPKPELQFVDLQGFDRDLGASLAAPLPQVEVAFYDRITPSAMPPRLEQWMAAVETGGGSVTVVPPKPSVTSKSPFLLISAISSLWSASKMAKEMSARALYKSAGAYDAQIILKTDDKGDSVVERVVFLQRKK